MSKRRKRSKKFQTQSHTPTRDTRRTSPTEDFVGKFMLSVLSGIITALISQAVSNQINWLIVFAVFIISLFALLAYQRSQ
jgi:Flp pilus assembly protein TadB